MKTRISLLVGIIALTTLSGCVVTPARPHASISIDYPNAEWQEHPKHDNGKHKGWYKNKGRWKD